MMNSNEGPVLTTDSTDGHRGGRNQEWNALDLCPSVESVTKTTPATENV
jgi:hypothetical protein